MRKLVSIQKILEINPIEGADQIECAVVLGWNVVVRKGEFKVGQEVVYFEIDSFLPPTEEFAFLLNGSYKKLVVDGEIKEGIILKTKKLRGVISQGLIMPLSILNGKKYPNDERENPIYELKEGDEITGLLGVYKWEAPISPQLEGIAKGNFPTFIPKTDEERLQNCKWMLDIYKGVRFYYTEKLDGSSCTMYKNEGVFGVCSRNLDLKYSEGNSYWNIAKKFDLENKLPEGYVIQGEVFGQGLQGNPLLCSDVEFRVFNVWNIIEGRYLNLDELKAFVGTLELEMVPIIYEGILHETFDNLMAMADSKSIFNPKVAKEGIVCRPIIETRNEKFGRVSFKVISNQYLLKQ